jgi:hypothetical protein
VRGDLILASHFVGCIATTELAWLIPRNDGMSDELRKPRRKWISRTLAALVVLGSYFAVHRATCQRSWYVARDALGQPRARIQRQHWFENKPCPLWVESFFQPASRIDDFIDPSPDKPACILMEPR